MPRELSVGNNSVKTALFFLVVLAISTSSTAAELTFSMTAMHFDTLESMCKKRVEETAARLGVELEFVELSFGRAPIWANNAKIDGLVARADYIEQSYPNLIKFGGECSRLVFDLVTLESNEFEFVDWKSVPVGYSLGYLQGAETVSKDIAIQNEKMNLVEVGTRSHLVDMFLSERFELLLTPANSIPQLEKRTHKSISVVKRNAIEVKLYPYIHKRHKNLFSAEAVVVESIP